MIKYLTVENFKSIYDETKLEMSPLTIFAGSNNSGKSTVIQCILLIAQTLQSAVSTRPIVLNGHIARLGTYDDIVSHEYNDKPIHIGFNLLPLSSEESTSFGSPYAGHPFMLERGRLINSLNCSLSFSSAGATGEKDILQLQPRLDSCDISCRFSLKEKDREKEESIVIKRSEKSTSDRAQKFNLQLDGSTQSSDQKYLEYEVIKPNSIRRIDRYYYALPVNAKIAGVRLRHFLPNALALVYDKVGDQVDSIVKSLTTTDDLPYRYMAAWEEHPGIDYSSINKLLIQSINQLLQDIEKPSGLYKNKLTSSSVKRLNILAEKIESRMDTTLDDSWFKLPTKVRRILSEILSERKGQLEKAVRADRQANYEIGLSALPEMTDFGVDYIQDFFIKNVKYLGPLRDEPKPIYPLAGSTDPRDVGFKGEHTAAVIDIHKNSLVEYIPSRYFSNPESSQIKEKVTLLEAVLDWLEYMGVASKIRTSDKGKLGHELRVSSAGESTLHDLTHVGVGVSQVLPILVLSLLADPGSTLIFEQPELHLHPRVQARLADFFVSMSRINKQCIVETHSEYFINRLRFQVAMSKSDELSKDVIIYFVEMDEGHSKYRPITINKFGVIAKWPIGFFDENERNSAEIIRASMLKKQQEKQNDNG
jgi:predicted ATPase